MKSFNDFLAWEKASRDSIDFKKIYVDVAGDLIAGLLLSQIIYNFAKNTRDFSRGMNSQYRTYVLNVV